MSSTIILGGGPREALRSRRGVEVEVEVVNEQVESGPGYRSEDSQREEV